jgi:hypothetical protein
MLQKAKSLWLRRRRTRPAGAITFEVDKADQAYCDAKRAKLKAAGLQCHAISTHLVGQAVCDNIDPRHKQILPPTSMAMATLKASASVPPRS